MHAGQTRCRTRLSDHQTFVAERLRDGKTLKHESTHYGFPVMTRQEREIELWEPVDITPSPNGVVCTHRGSERHASSGDGVLGDLFAEVELNGK